jgi:ribose transport system permease protein
MSPTDTLKKRLAPFARPWMGPLLALVILYVVFAVMTDGGFLRGVTQVTIARQTVVVGLGAVGMTLVIVSGGIDLSIGSVVALSAVVVAKALDDGQGPVTAALFGAGVGLLCGALNGALVAALRITPFIVTLGTMSALRGVAKGLANEQKIDADARGLDELMAMVPAGSPLIWPLGVWIAILLTVAGGVVLARSRFGRHVMAVGSSPPAARLAGLSVGRVTLGAYAVAGLLAGIAGVLDFATLTVGDPTGSAGLELSVIAAVVIGGGSLSGGQGSVAGSLVGALLMTVLAAGATQLGIANWVQEILTGAIIVIAVALDRLRHRIA